MQIDDNLVREMKKINPDKQCLLGMFVGFVNESCHEGKSAEARRDGITDRQIQLKEEAEILATLMAKGLPQTAAEVLADIQAKKDNCIQTQRFERAAFYRDIEVAARYALAA